MALYRLIFVLLIVVNAYSENLVNLYRSEGIKSVEKEINSLLKSKDYWNSYLKNQDVSYGYYEVDKNILLTEKENSKIFLYNYDNGKLDLISQNEVIVGEKFGDKYKEGDKKTPLGVYDLTQRKTRLDAFYGPLALVTSYPNTFDKVSKKSGSGIWIHGMPLNEDREKFTKGCIALDNDKLKELSSSINLNKSVLITSQGTLKKATKNDVSNIMVAIFKWRDAWKYSDIKTYLSFYDKDFKRYDGMKFFEFSTYKKRIFSKNERKTIKFKNIEVIPYPNSLNKKMFKIIMDEEYISSSIRFFGKKELYVQLIDGKVKILTEG